MTSRVVFSSSGPVVIKTTLDVIPANEATVAKYSEWTTILQYELSQNAGTGRKPLQGFTEEMVTVDRLRDDHCPNQLLPSLQLPSLVTNQDQDHCKRIHMEWGHLMEARDRSVRRNRGGWTKASMFSSLASFSAPSTG